MQDISTGKKAASYIVRAIAVFLSIYSLLAVILIYDYLLIARDQGYTAIEEQFSQKDSISVITNIIPNSPAELSGLRSGDTITHANNRRIGYNNQSFTRIVGIPKIGDSVLVTIQRASLTQNITFSIVELPLYDKVLEVLFRIVPVFIMIGFLIAGIWGLLKNPYSTETLLISMFCFSFGGFIYSTVEFSVLLENFITRIFYFYEIKRMLLLFTMMAPSFWLYLFLIFPRPFRFYEKNKLLSYIIIFLIPLLVYASFIFNLRVNFLIIFALISIYIALGVVLLAINLRRTKNALERRQIKLVLLGVKYGTLSILFGWLQYIFAFNLFEKNITVMWISLTILLFGEIGGLIIPLTFINSFAKNKLLETEGALKRRVRYILFTTMLLLVYLSLIFILVRLSINILNLKDPTLVIISVLLLSLTFTPLNKKLLAWIDEKFYPERTRYASAFKNFIQNLPGHIESDEVLESLKLWLQNTLRIEPIIPVALQSNGKEATLFKPNEKNSVLHKVKSGNKFFWDEITDNSIMNIHREEMRWAKDNDISITIPMIAHGEVLGMLNVGKRTDKEDFSTDDLDILTQASNQTAFTLRNLKLQQEFIQKKRQDKELEMARRIQRQLLPQKLPIIDRLECYGMSKPCFEVAGDYFDIIKLDDGNAVFVVADVSGKGAGAALIMANLQASIRVGIHLSDSLSDFVCRINELIFTNTSTSEFVTFFMGIWVPSENAIYFVNAGQNPPILISKDNSIKFLEPTGMILGIMPEQKYDTKKIIIESDDVLLIYTDGLEEAMNAKEELFGTERIIEVLKSNKTKPAMNIADNLINAAEVFCDDEPLHDDLTMIIIKRN